MTSYCSWPHRVIVTQVVGSEIPSGHLSEISCPHWKELVSPADRCSLGGAPLSRLMGARLIQYSAFKELLGTGLNAHIQGNNLLRDVFRAGASTSSYCRQHGLQTREEILQCSSFPRTDLNLEGN